MPLVFSGVSYCFFRILGFVLSDSSFASFLEWKIFSLSGFYVGL